MKKNIVIIGASGHGRVIRDVAFSCGYEKAIFLDDTQCDDIEISGKTKDYINYISDSDFFVAIGNNAVREKIISMLVSSGGKMATLIHPSAVIGSNVKIGKGTVVAPGAVICTGSSVGEGVIINTCSSVDHDDVVENFCHISVGSHLAGTVRIGKRTFVGAGATVINNISICDDCIIGAGASVVRDITESGTYVGVPAIKIRD